MNIWHTILRGVQPGEYSDRAIRERRQRAKAGLCICPSIASNADRCPVHDSRGRVRPGYPPQAKKYEAALAALAQVEALAEAAHRMDDWDFAALPHLENGWRAIAQDDVDALTAEVAALRAALVPFAAHKDTA